TLIVAVAPKPPVNHLLDDDVEDKEEDELKFRIPQMTTLCKRKFFMFLRDKLRLPDIILMLLFSLSMKAWIIIAMWFLLAPIAQKYDIGPLYIIGTGFLIILINLGRRQQGDVSKHGYMICYGTLHTLVFFGVIGCIKVLFSFGQQLFWYMLPYCDDKVSHKFYLDSAHVVMQIFF
ncbi:hypothetical protein ACJX0J_017268, partial [Zea mays]